jgi:7,8-dihydropterin-6-yl-methyl-4-(beta-D-ribofuranosyl)aminobenzene 5'-phosphate synthase
VLSVVKNTKVDYVKDEGFESINLTVVGHFYRLWASGLIDIVRHCQRITGINHVHALFGGFHLRSVATISSGLSGSFTHLKPDKIMGCHCTGKWGNLWLPEAVSRRQGMFMFWVRT